LPRNLQNEALPHEAGSKAYRAYVLVALLSAYCLNYLDRNLLSVLNEPIRKALGLGDFEMGLLGGPSFAVLFAVLGLPLARLADNYDRRKIIALSVVVWSAMTALSGAVGWLPPWLHVGIFVLLLAPLVALFVIKRMMISAALTLGAAAVSIAWLPLLSSYGLLTFGLLLMTRLGVGIGEAGGGPPAMSLVADYYPASRRATALSIFSLGIPLGGLLAAIGGGLLAQMLGWRAAFLALGLPGVLIGLTVFITVREPLRSNGTAPTPLSEVLRRLASNSTFRTVTAAAAMSAFIGYGTGQFSFAYLSRAYGLSVLQAAALAGITAALASAVGIVLGGVVSDRLAQRLPNAAMVVPGLAMILATPLLLLAFTAPTPAAFIGFIAPASVLQYMYLGPITATIQTLAPTHMRATAIAVFAFMVTLVGFGLGPPFVGYLSDRLTSGAFNRATMQSFHDVCAHAAQAGAACRRAETIGLRTAMMICVCGYLPAGLLMLRSGRHSQADTSDQAGAAHSDGRRTAVRPGRSGTNARR
jgi:MFS family permease